MRRLGIFGGTFNPVHIAHLIIAQDVWERFELEKLVFVPAAAPPHKHDPSIVSPLHRCSMLSLAIEANPAFEVSDVEIRRGGRSYTVDTLATFRKIYPRPIELLFIMGLDQALEIQTWKEPETLFALADIVVVSRPSYELAGLKEEIKEKVRLHQGRLVDISSTEIRRRVEAGQPIKYLVPGAVESYIHDHGLYLPR